MWFLTILSWFGVVVQFSFVVLSLAAGLYYLAELVEEYTVVTGKVIKHMIMVNAAIYICFMLFEEFPFKLIVCGLFSCGSYYAMLQSFPVFELTSPSFISSIILLLVNHYFAFEYFAEEWHPFTEVLGFFVISLWMVPFAFFISLSANEFTLPTTVSASVDSQQMFSARTDNEESDVVSNYFSKKGKKFGLLTFLKSAQDTLLPQKVKKTF